MTQGKDTQPRILSDEEIELYLQGERREVDRLILLSLNRLAAALIPHTERESALSARLESIGGMERICRRAEFVDQLIERQKLRNEMMIKVSQSTTTWALIAFFGFVVAASWDAIIHAIRAKLGGA